MQIFGRPRQIPSRLVQRDACLRPPLSDPLLFDDARISITESSDRTIGCGSVDGFALRRSCGSVTRLGRTQICSGRAFIQRIRGVRPLRSSRTAYGAAVRKRRSAGT